MIVEENNFNKFGFSKDVMQAIEAKGFEEPTNIQSLTIPAMLENRRDIIAQAQTGTGKTAAFGLPLVELIDEENQNVQALILVPTRELAIQVSEEINSLTVKKKLKITPIYGGQSINQQFRSLKKGIHIVVGTPGRIIDHLNRKTLKISEVENLILDEADEMLNMGFIEDIEKIMKYMSHDKRILLFSATMPRKIKDLSQKYLEKPIMLKTKDDVLVTGLTEQIYFEVKNRDKFEALCRIIDIEENFYGIVFCRTRKDADEINTHLSNRSYDSGVIHGEVSQRERENILGKFRNKNINILVATDVAARGIDVDNLTHVINYSLPQDPEAYVHRIGRTGRAGNKGTAVTFIAPSEYQKLMFIKKVAKTDIKKSLVPQPEEIISTKKKKINNDLKELLENNVDANYYTWAKQLLSKYNATEVLASILAYSFSDDLNTDVYNNIQNVKSSSEDVDSEGKARLFVALGKLDGIKKDSLIDLIRDRVSIKRKQIKDIQIMKKFSFITVPFTKAEEIISCFRHDSERPMIVHAKKDKRPLKR